MNRVIFPLSPGARGPAVVDLQDALLLFLDRDLIVPGDVEAHRFLSEGLRRDRAEQAYGNYTARAVANFQAERGLEATGEVDEATAGAINGLLRELGLLDGRADGRSLVVSGTVRRDDGAPYAGGQVRAFHQAGDGAIRLGEDATDEGGRYTIRYLPLPDGAPITLLVAVSDQAGRLLVESDLLSDAKPVTIIDLVVPDSERATYLVEGDVVNRVSAAVGGLDIQIVDKGIGGDVELARAVTNARGSYQAAFTYLPRQRGKPRPDLQAKVWQGEQLLASSEARYDAGPRETLHIRLDDKVAASLSSEHATLTRTLRDQGAARLADLRETDGQQDITYLANKTGWDARAVASAALADQFSERAAQADAPIDPSLFYALFRAGLPTSDEALYTIAPGQAETVWRQALKQGVIPAELEEGLPAAAEQFASLAARRLVDGPPTAGLSSLPDVAAIALGDDAERKLAFAGLLARNRDTPDEFWGAVRDTFGEDTEQQLRLDGQLAYLTFNNAPLIHALHERGEGGRLSSPLDLVGAGLYAAAAWRELIGESEAPPEISGGDAEQKRARYAELLAAQVRLSYPTAVVAQQVHRGLTPVDAAVAQPVQEFLMAHQDRFEIGRQPVEHYLAQNDVALDPAVTQAVATIQRIYQITPSDEAMNALLQRDVTSAFAVARYGEDEFVRTFQDDLGEAAARQVHVKALQVHNATLNIAVSYLTARTAPAIGAHSAPRFISPAPTGPSPHTSDVIAYPTLEKLFGGMDYCACDHCRSVLSPAAYLVDLLLFLERDPQAWTTFVNRWRQAHENAPYPFLDIVAFNAFQADWNARNPGQPLPDTEIQPQEVLLSRRPDIAHLPLTCENTNAPLPYIDLVNETLEYFVTSGLTLQNYQGHTTDGRASAAELLANPQFVSDAAYTQLAGERFPPPLPFHRALEQSRRTFGRFDAPLARVMEDLRVDDSLERATPQGYGWRDILMEELALARAEHTLLTDRTVTLAQLYGFPDGTAVADVAAALSSAKRFARRLDITYQQLVDILKTRFVNPHSTLLGRLERLGVPFSTLKAYKDGAITDAQFDAAIAPKLDPAQYGGDIKAWVKNEANYANVMRLITLTDPSGESPACDFDRVELRYAEPDMEANRLRPFDFVRLLRFIRLWRKLGWSIQQTDQALTALYPPDQVPDDPDDEVNLARLDAGFLTLLPRLGVVKRLLADLSLKPQRDLAPLLASFAPLDTHGDASLYRRLFLSAALGPQDDAFADDGYGNVLSDPTIMLLPHADALRAALGLKADELDAIISTLGFNAATPLSLENVSAIYRRGWLARALKVSVPELLALVRFTGIDPFAPPDPPAPGVVRFRELMTRLRVIRLKPVTTLFAVWNLDVTGKASPDEADVLAFVTSLRDASTAIDAEFASVPEDPDGLVARSRMALVYGSDATNLFFGLLEDSYLTEVVYSQPQPELAPEVEAAAPGRIGYDRFRKRLTYGGLLTQATRDALKGVAGVSGDFQDAVDRLYSENQRVVSPFFARYPELLPLHAAYAASADPPAKKRAALLSAFLPALIARRQRAQTLQAISAAAGVGIDLAAALLDDAAVLHTAEDAARPALDDLIAGATPGLSATIFFSDTATGGSQPVRHAEANLAYRAGTANVLPVNPAAGERISGIWRGYLEAPEDGFYNIGIESDANAVHLELGGSAIDLTQAGSVWASNEPIELIAGTLSPVTVTIEGALNTLIVRWETTGRGWEVIPAGSLFSATLGQLLRRIFIRFLKIASLAKALELTAAEMTYLATRPELQINGADWLNALPVEGEPDAPLAAALFGAFDGALAFARLKAALSPDDERLLTVLRDPAATTTQGESLLLSLTRWDPGSLDALLVRFGHVNGGNANRGAVASLATFARVHDAYAWVEALGISAAALEAATTNEPDAAIVRNLQAALRARYDADDWLELVRPMNDQLRELQRDALVSSILREFSHHPENAHIDTPDKLFEYFLMDVQMAACMQTSRIRHALSSIQLFISRCFLNLEPRVAPSALNAAHWEWMSRYRVWEANRQVFLFPENWLEPELRTDQSPFFREAMSELLQSDITEERAAVALLNYLAKLDEVAKLEPCGIHYLTNETGASDDVAHIIARTTGASRKYFYRRREYGYWTPWEQVRLDIEGDPVIPVVWKDRLFLFWLRILKQAPLDPPDPPAGHLADLDARAIIPKDPPQVSIYGILCWSEFYNGKWQEMRTSDVDKPLYLDSKPASGDGTYDRATLKLSVLPWTRDALRIIVSNEVGAGSSFFLHNTFSAPELREEKKARHFSPRRILGTAGNPLEVAYPGAHATHPVLANAIADRTVEPNHPASGDPWDVPFFYGDSRHVFYVTTSKELVMVPHQVWFGGVTMTPADKLDLPPLVAERRERIPDLIGPYARQPGFGVVDPAPMARYVTEDAYIRHGIASIGTVRFGEMEIGPTGSQIAGIRAR